MALADFLQPVTLIIIVVALILGWLFGFLVAKMAKKSPNGTKRTDTTLGNELRAVLNSIDDGVVVINHTGDIQHINPAAIHITGWGNDDPHGLNFYSVVNLFYKDDPQLTDDTNPIVIATKTRKPLESRDYAVLTKISNKKVRVQLYVAATTDDYSTLVVTFRDIEKQLKDSEQQQEFISTASHEMRTPVASIEGYLGLALNPATATLDARGQEYIQKAHEASQHLGTLFRDLLDVTKLDDGRDHQKLQLIDVVDFVSKVGQDHQLAIQQKGLEYHFSPKPTVPGERIIKQSLYANIDPSFLREALDNLIDNAVKYTPSGSVSVNVHGEPDNIVISVADTGIGIAPEDIKHLFQKFYRVDNTDTREIGGTGLGLYISKKRIEDLGGRLWVESEYKKGSTFKIQIPRLSEDNVVKMQAMAQIATGSNYHPMSPSPTNSNYRPATPPVQPERPQ